DWSAEWMVQWLRKMLREDIASVAPKQDVVDELGRYGDEIMKTLTWTGNCIFLPPPFLFFLSPLRGCRNELTGAGRSWYKQNRIDGRVTATFAGSAMLFHDM